MITKRFPNQSDILSLPMIELWGDLNHSTARRHLWKWRFSRNKPEITHGVNKHARITDEKTGKVYAKQGMSDGCEYVNTINYEPLGHVGFWTQELELMRRHQPEQFGVVMNQVYRQIPAVWHTSWLSFETKINQLKKDGMWCKLWGGLYKSDVSDRFPNVNTPEGLDKTIKNLMIGGEESDEIKYKFELEQLPPKLLREWYDLRK